MNLKTLTATLLTIIFSLAGMLISGCDSDDDPVVVDLTPPAVPTGVFSVTGNQVVSIYWHDITEEDLIGYDVYRHDGDDPIYGDYHYLGTVPWDEQLTDDYILHYFDDFEVVNGQTYYYAVLSYDQAGNESDLSYETVLDTPRPEGAGVVLFTETVDDTKCGLDFSATTPSAQISTAPSTDIIVESDPATDILYVRKARDEVALQDYGLIDLIWVDYAPMSGYSAAGRAELIVGHSYIVKITNAASMNYAKFQVTSMTNDSVEIAWAYQIDVNNRELSLPSDGRISSAESSTRPIDIIRF